jgi:hypothetical protein
MDDGKKDQRNDGRSHFDFLVLLSLKHTSQNPFFSCSAGPLKLNVLLIEHHKKSDGVRSGDRAGHSITSLYKSIIMYNIYLYNNIQGD